jgi:hypothetical protein
VTSTAHCGRSSTRPLPRRRCWSRSFPGERGQLLWPRLVRFSSSGARSLDETHPGKVPVRSRSMCCDSWSKRHQVSVPPGR